MIKLGEICLITMGQSPDSATYNESGNGLPFFQGNADFGKINPTARIWCSEPKKIANPNDILISVRAPIGALNIADVKCCIGRGLASITVNDDKIIEKYIWYALESKVNKLISMGTGSTFKAIGKDVLCNLEIPLPSPEIQHQIATTLDKVTHTINLCNTILKKLDLLVKSRFVEMFGEPISNSMDWERCELGACLESIDNGKSYVCDNDCRTGDNPAILKLSAVTYGIYKPDENKAMIDEDLFDESAEVKNNDLLFTRKNTPELVGMSAYVFNTPPKLMMPDLIFRLNAKASCNKIYLWQLINHDLFRPCIQNIANGSAKSMSNISKERLSRLTIPVPPLALQQQFAAFVKQTDKSKFTAENLQRLIRRVRLNDQF